MEAIVRSGSTYLLLFLIFRVMGKRTLAQVTAFDFVLLIIVGEATASALIGNDHSITNLMLVIITLIVIKKVLDLIRTSSESASKTLEDVPLILVDNGKPIKDRITREHLREDDILESAREIHGLER